MLAVVLYGALAIGVAFLTPLLGSSVVQLALSIVGTLGSPIFALFALGILFPFINNWVSIAKENIQTSVLYTLWYNRGTVYWLSIGPFMTSV